MSPEQFVTLRALALGPKSSLIGVGRSCSNFPHGDTHHTTPSTRFRRIRRSLTAGNKFISLERNGPQRHVALKIQKKNMSEDFPDKIECSRRSRARARLRASKRGNFVGNQRFLKRYVGRKTKGDTYYKEAELFEYYGLHNYQ
jgi:hypothetical protein